MTFSNEKLNKLVQEGLEKGYIQTRKLLEICDDNSDELDQVTSYLEKEGIDLVSDDEIKNYDTNFDENLEEFKDDFQSDSEFLLLNKEVEDDLKNKDIDDTISSSTVSVQSDDPMRMYLREIGSVPLLSAYQEVDLSKKVKDGLLAKEKLNQIKRGKNKVQYTDEEIQEFEDLVQLGLDARNIIIESNLRLVVSVAKKFQNRGLQIQDLIQEGNLGLMKAVNKFDYTRGYKFSTYATWWIRQGIQRAISDQARTIRIPVHMVETINKLIRTQRKLTQELRRDPTPEELAKEMGFSVEKIHQIQKIAQEPVSLETPVGEEDDSSLGDFVPDRDALNPLEYTINEYKKQDVDKVLKTLSTKEEEIMRYRFGFVEGRIYTLEEVGNKLGVTRERIRQIQVKATKSLGKPNRKSILAQYK